jgi:hypothetical protein
MRLLLLALTAAVAAPAILAAPELPLLSPPYRWVLSAPVIAPAGRPDDPCHAIKDPTVVFHDGRWHLFCTIRCRKRTHQIEYLSFADWSKTADAKRHVLTLTDGYFCAPQVFYFTPHKKWYLVYQVADPTRKPQLQPAFSTTADLTDPTSWTKPALLFERDPEGVTGWIDFWVICDDTHARLFFTSLNGKMWRSDAKLADFPHGWSKPEVVLQGDIFEASHTYRVKGGGYLTIVEAQAGDRAITRRTAPIVSTAPGSRSPTAATTLSRAGPTSNRRAGRAGPTASATANSCEPASMRSWKSTRPRLASCSRACRMPTAAARSTATSPGGWDCSS